MKKSDFLDDFNAIMHRIKVKLRPNYLPGIPGKYIARTANERILGVRDILAALRKRGGYKGDLNELYDGLRCYYSEMLYQLRDGYGINTGLYFIQANIGGTFESAKDTNDPQKNPVSYRISPRAILREQAENLEVEVVGVADDKAWIDTIEDVSTEAVNECLTVGKNFQIEGSKIKVAGEPEMDYGVYFIPDNGTAEVKVTERLMVNQSACVAGLVPDLDPDKHWRVQIRTHYANSSNFLKNQQVLTLENELVVNP
jgi:hypothetical protein